MPKETRCAKADDVPQIDAAYFNQKGAFRPHEPINGFMETERGGKTLFAVGFSVSIRPHGASYMTIMFPITQHNISQEDIATRTVSLLPSSCQFGGLRWWFQCPECLKRARILYFRGERVQCRRCHGLWYRSQTVERLTCLSRKVEKMGSEDRWRHYRGKPTRRHKSFLKWKERLDRIEC